MLETDIKKFREMLDFKFNNAKDLDLQWEAKAYSDCLEMMDAILKKNGLSVS
jgi:hypothetical protein